MATGTISMEDLETRFEGRNVYLEVVDDGENYPYLVVENNDADRLVIFASSVSEDEIELPVRWATLSNTRTYWGAVNEISKEHDFQGVQDIADFAYAIAKSML